MAASAISICSQVIVLLRLTEVLDSMLMFSAAYAGEEPMMRMKPYKFPKKKSLLANAMILTTEQWTSMAASAISICFQVTVFLSTTEVLDSMPMCSAAYAEEEPMMRMKPSKIPLSNVKTQTMVRKMSMVTAVKMVILVHTLCIVKTQITTTTTLMHKKCAAAVEEEPLPEK